MSHLNWLIHGSLHLTLFLFLLFRQVNNTEDMKVKNYEPRVDGVIDDHNWSGGSSSTSGGSSSNNGVSRQYQYHQQQQQQSSASSSYGRRPESNVQGVEDRGRVVEPRNTYTSIAGIEFRLTDRQQFHRLGQILTIRCEAVVVDQKWATQTNITQQPSQLSIAGQNRYSSSGKLSVSWLFDSVACKGENDWSTDRVFLKW